MCSQRDTFVLPAFPADRVVDPTGAGDSFAGGMMGYLATQGSSAFLHAKPHAFRSQHASRLVSVNATKDYQSWTRQGSSNGRN